MSSNASLIRTTTPRIKRFQRIFARLITILTITALSATLALTFAGCSEEHLATQTANAVNDAEETAVSELIEGDISIVEARATAEAAEARATADPLGTVVAATTTAEAIATREVQNDYVEIADTALAGGKINLDQFIDIAETIKAGGDPGDEFDQILADALAARPPIPDPEILPTPLPTKPVEPTPVKASEYRSVNIYRSESWSIGETDPKAYPRDGSTGKIGLGFIDLFYTKSLPDTPNYDWTIEFSFGSPYADQAVGRTITLIGRAKATGGGSVDAVLKPLVMYFISDLPPENIEIVETTGPLEIAYGETAKLEVKVTIPKGNIGDQFTMGWGVEGCIQECEYYWTYEAQ
ncbi:MAG: hypothetical protein H8D69_02970 [Chloroflexi bacterium]|nr:hypothetical protein [Chloroflexota bacterium]